MSRPVRVAQVVGNLETGGMQMLVMALMRGLDRDRFDPILIHFKGPNHFEDEIRERGWRCAKVPLNREYQPRRIRALARALRDEEVDLVHAHSDFAAFAGRAAVVLAGGCRVIAHYHNTYDHRLDALFRAREALLTPRTDLLAACSRGVEDFIRETFDIGDTPLRAIVNGTDTAPFEAAGAKREEIRRAFDIPPKTFHIVHTARLEPHKTPHNLIEAVSRAGDTLGDWRVTFVGGGSLSESLQATVRDRGLAERIRFTGWSNRIADHLASADVFILCSRNEGLPLTLVEAMASGTPVIASDIIGPREVVTDGQSGLLVQADDPPSLLAAIQRIHDDDALRERLAEHGRRAARNFTIERYLTQTHQIYDETLARPPRNPSPLAGPLRRRRFLNAMRTGARRDMKASINRPSSRP